MSICFNTQSTEVVIQIKQIKKGLKTRNINLILNPLIKN